jgi:hypothetical protein
MKRPLRYWLLAPTIWLHDSSGQVTWSGYRGRWNKLNMKRIHAYNRMNEYLPKRGIWSLILFALFVIIGIKIVGSLIQ